MSGLADEMSDAANQRSDQTIGPILHQLGFDSPAVS